MITKLPNGGWKVDVTIGTKLDGQRDRRVRRFKTKKEAEKYERSLLVKKDAKLVSGRITIDEFIESIYWEQKKNIRPNTKRGYERDIRLRILPALSGKLLEDISRYDVQEMISDCATKKVATNARETLSTILSLACEMELIPRNVAGYRYQYPKKGDSNPEEFGVWLSTFAEHHDFFKSIAKLEHAPMVDRIYVLGLCFGLRKGEIFGLDWENVDLEKRLIQINKTYVVAKGGATLEAPKTDSSYRYIPMPKFAYNYFMYWYRSGITGAVVTTRTGQRMSPNSGHNMIQRFLKKYPDLPHVTIFSTRHSFATACINAGVDVAKVSKWLGHAEVSTTYNRYVKPMIKDLEAEIATIDAAFNA